MCPWMEGGVAPTHCVEEEQFHLYLPAAFLAPAMEELFILVSISACKAWAGEMLHYLLSIRCPAGPVGEVNGHKLWGVQGCNPPSPQESKPANIMPQTPLKQKQASEHIGNIYML